MNNIRVELFVPEHLLEQVKEVSRAYQSDFETDMVRLMEIYVSSYQAILADPAARALVGGV